MSPRNSVPAVINMLEKSGCHHIVSQPAFDGVVSSVKVQLEGKNHSLRVHELPSLHKIFPQLGGSQDSVAVDPFPPNPSPPSMDSPALYLHSSGSTGLPKPIPQSHIAAVEWCSACK